MRVVVTRASHQAGKLAELLRGRGAEVLFLPVIAIAPPEDPEPLRNAAANMNSYDWIVFSSANAVEAFAGQTGNTRCTAKVAAVGSATRERAHQLGFTVTATPENYVAEALALALENFPMKNARILIPSAEVTRDVVARELRARGAQVDVVTAYRNVAPAEALDLAASIFSEPLPDWITFASSSAAQHLVELVNPDLLRRIKIASIGPVTSYTVRSLGFQVTAEARVSTAEGLAEAVFSA